MTNRLLPKAVNPWHRRAVWMFFLKSHLISITRCCIAINVIVTPHNAGMTAESILEMVTATAHPVD